MNAAARVALVRHPNTIFQLDSQRKDLLNANLTQDALIALLTDLCITRRYAIEITAVRSDHHDDSDLGEHCHARGWCVDLWPLRSPKAGDYMDETTHDFRQFLRDVAASPHLYQIGLAGAADNLACRIAAGSSCYRDDGGDHIHLGARA
ncbi:MAG: hypothetical protein NVS2B17_29230 [Candidatus Velthaea sp.]